ncbi:MAG: DNA methylase [Erysipelotrichaceae bacterium]|nr:DNA methylase [Erysipelotrichaceae bacterium]
MKKRTYIAIDLKSFYASVECAERDLDPLTTNLVVADASLTAKTICLAVSPSLKQYGLSGRSRLYEVVATVDRLNEKRRKQLKNYEFSGSSCDDDELKSHPELSVNYVIATPRMALYMEYSTRIYDIYLKYFSADDIHVYSIDEVFIDATSYLKTYGMDAEALTRKVINDVLSQTGITATAGIAENMYLCKVAMDIVAKHMPPDENGVRIAVLDEMNYRQKLWHHQPLTDFWRVGRGYQRRLEEIGLHTMGDIARCSLGKPSDFYNEDLLYRMFGVNAELLIDHAWGYEPVTIADIKAYKPQSNSLSVGQVLHHPYDYEHTLIIIKEMAENLSFQLLERKMVSDCIVLTVGYDIENLRADNLNSNDYQGEVVKDFYGREVPKAAHGSIDLPLQTSSVQIITDNAVRLFDRIINRKLLTRRITIAAMNVVAEEQAAIKDNYEQLDLFSEPSAQSSKVDQKEMEREKKIQNTIMNIRSRYGKNSLIHTSDLQDQATTIERNSSIGGHKA